MINGYMTIKEAAKKWDISSRRVQMFCVEGRIDGVTKFGREWAIPVDANKPDDKRVTTGQYSNWRKPDKQNEDGSILYELSVGENEYQFSTSLNDAMASAEFELASVSERLDENLITIKKLTPECDKLDYILAAGSGALCGVLDVFLVGKPGESPIGELTDKWFEDRTKSFAKLCGWDNSSNESLSSAMRHLEKKFKIPYDQRGAGDAASDIFNLTPTNHHFKSLGHNPTLLGLFFSVLDQFTNRSHFISEGELIALEEADGNFELRGNNVPSKLFCGIANWFGHLVSDISGSSSSKGRGMGIPSPIWSWTNDVIAIKKKLKIPVSEFDKNFNELALKIYEEGYDARFQAVQAIPVLINELLVRVMYSVRRLISYYAQTKKADRSFSTLWKSCEPFSNATVKRMLTVAHGTFCLIDAGDATVQGFKAGAGSFNVAEFFMRINIVGVGRFTISLFGEVHRGAKKSAIKEEVVILQREKMVLEYYIDGLNKLAAMYDDALLDFVQDFKTSRPYAEAFEKTVRLAEMRNVPEQELLHNKAEIDSYFRGGKAH